VPVDTCAIPVPSQRNGIGMFITIIGQNHSFQVLVKRYGHV